MTKNTSSRIAHRRKSDGEIQDIQDHLVNVGSLSGKYANKLGLAAVGEVVGLLHDAGKASDQFQTYIKSATGLLNPDIDDEYVDSAQLQGRIDHPTAGGKWIWSRLKNSDIVTAQALALCIASHHSGLIDCVGASETNFGSSVFCKRMSKSDAKTNYTEIVEKIPPSIFARCESILTSENGAFRQRCENAMGLSEGNENTFCTQLGLLVRFVFSCLIDGDRTDTANFEYPHQTQLVSTDSRYDWDVLVDRLESSVAKLEVNYEIDNVRAAVSNRCKEMASKPQGTFALSVPTGGGKTFSSLRFALHHAQKHGLDRVIYVIPYTSIIDQNAKAARKVLDDRHDEFVLEVHSNLTPRRQSYRDKVLAANWNAPVVFTTMVQFLESLFGSGTRGARRMHQLARSVVVFDEIQSLPIKCVHLFNQAANFLVEQCDSSVVLCTATQPLLHSVDAAKGKLKVRPECEITENTDQLYHNLKRTSVRNETRLGGWSNAEITELAIEQMDDSNSCLIVANTKKMARSIFELVTSTECGEPFETFHLSTNMCPAHRKMVLYLIRRSLNSENRVICVSTQLIEAGVDVDFGSAIRFLAGLDSIAQTAGRCNRSGIRETGNVFVVNPTEENLNGLPEIQEAIRSTKRVLNDFAGAPEKYDHDLIGPKAMEWFYQNYFYARANEMDYPISASKIGHDDTILNLLGRNKFATAELRQRNKQVENLCFKQAFMTAARSFDVIDAPTEGVVVPFGRRGAKLVGRLASQEFVHNPFTLLREAQQFTVNVFPRVFSKLKEADAIKPLSEDFSIYHLDPQFYDNQFGLSTDPVTKMELLHA